MSCGTPERPHRPKRIEVRDERGRTRLLGSACECGALFNKRGNPTGRRKSVGFFPVYSRSVRRMIDLLRLRRKRQKAIQRGSL